MQFNVSELLRSPVGTERRYALDEQKRSFEDQGGVIQGTARLMRTTSAVLVMAEVATGVEVSCSRCLAQFVCPVEFEMAEEYFPALDIATGRRTQAQSDGAFEIDTSHILDLSEAVGQHAVLALPMKPLCALDCAGLCTNCGAQLNQVNCGCLIDDVDSRWVKLKALGFELDEQ